MVLYPQLYSTVNQNQIHLHLHGPPPDKLEQYLQGAAAVDSSLALNSATALNSSRCLELGSLETGLVGLQPDAHEYIDATTLLQQQPGRLNEDPTTTTTASHARDAVVTGAVAAAGGGDPNSVWRPY